ncbi:MAG: hypothetical protein WCB05_19730 [Candidatus Sulfotelmatobacter sp.]|jgi:hypothetical protein
MKLRLITQGFMVCALISLSAVMSAGQEHRAVFAPHAVGVNPPPITKGAVVQREVPASTATWTKAKNTPPASVGSMLLLTDGRVLVHSEPNCSGCTGNYANWYTLTPDNTGSYVNGTWLQVASLPSGYAPLFFGSAVLADGKVVVQGGEYNCTSGCSGIWQSKGALYDPAANTWTSTTAPAKSNIGDAESVVLPDGTWMLAECCAIAFGNSTFPVYYYFNESTLSFTSEASATDGKNDDFDEEGWNLLPNGTILTVDAYTSNTVLTGTNSETYESTSNKWSTAGSTIEQLWDSNCEAGGGSFEVGPAVLRPDGTVFATGASDCEAGHTSVYDSTSGTWTKGPDFPNSDAANDAPASLEINGNVIVEGSPFSGTFSSPSNFYEWNGTTLTSFPNPPNAVNTASYQGHLLILPNGQIMYTDFSTDVEFLTSAGTFNAAWQPTITSVPSTLDAGTTYTISGTQFNGLSQGAAYGDDFQDATNYPLVQIVNSGTGHVFYAKTHNHSTMGIATGSTIVSTNFDVPSSIETGTSTIFVIANGIPSAGVAVTIAGATSGFSLSANPTSVPVVQGKSGTSVITSTTTGGFDTAVVLSASGQPSGVTVSFKPTSITGTGNSTMTMAVASTVAVGTYNITVTGTAGSTKETTIVSLVVSAASGGSFTLKAAPTKVSVAPGGHGTSKITAAPSGGFKSAIALSASGMPTGVTVTFKPTSIANGSGSSTATITVSKTAKAGTSTITVTGTGGGVTKTVKITLTIT